MFSFQGKKVLVTGGTGGIGRAIVKYFDELGANVGISDFNEEKMKEVVSGLKNKGYAFKCDLSNEEETEALVDKADAEMGGIDVLVCNAGLTKDSLAIRMKNEDFDLVMKINLRAAFILNRNAVKLMMKRRYGRIVNMASIVGVTGNPGQVNYSASKAGMIAMSKCMAAEVASRGITINCIAPGFIKTPMTDVLTEDQKAKLIQNNPTARMGLPEEIAAGVVFLASEEAAYITGQTLHINGGMAMI